MSSRDAWNPTQYEKFQKERDEPFYDLMGLLPEIKYGKIVDLGCGTGALTKVLHERLKPKTTLGTDNSDAMLTKAATFTSPGLTFQKSSIENFHEPNQFDLIFSNAALHWCSNHPGLLSRLTESLTPKGQLAIQIPANHDYPTHRLANELAREEPYFTLLGGKAVDPSVLSASEYAKLLFELGFKTQKVFLRVYLHILPNRDEVFEWIKGTLLTRFESQLPKDSFQSFQQELKKRLDQVLPEKTPFPYPFQRILFWAQK